MYMYKSLIRIKKYDINSAKKYRNYKFKNLAHTYISEQSKAKSERVKENGGERGYRDDI